MICHWCGKPHDQDRLCVRAQRSMTRRSFCFLFGAGIAGAMLPNVDEPYWAWVGRPKPSPDLVLPYRLVWVTEELLRSNLVDAEKFITLNVDWPTNTRQGYFRTRVAYSDSPSPYDLNHVAKIRGAK